MRRLSLFSLLLLLLPASFYAQGVSCPAVVASPDTTLNCNDCVLLRATPVSGFSPTTYTTQSIPYNPYSFNTGTSILVAQDDAWGPVVNLPFAFCFYGNNYTQCQAGSNGLLSFNLYTPNSYCQWPINNPIPNVNNPMNSIMGPWHDINPSFGGTVFTQLYGVAPCRVFVVSWENNAMFSCTNVTTSQQIAIYETTNIVEVYIRSKPLCATWNGGASILGVHNATGTQAVVVPGRNYPTQWSATNEGWRFVPAGAPNYTVAWYQVGNPVPLTTMDTITVCPTAVTDYYAQVVYTNCNGTTVTVRDTATINASVSNMVLSTVHADAACNGSLNGTATVNVTGNTGSITYAWSNGPTTSSISGLAAGVYTVTVTEQGGCTAQASVTVLQPPAIVLVPQHTDVLCNGLSTGTASVAASGGTGAFTYAWSNGANGASQTSLPAGTYTVTVTDANLCQMTSTITILQPPALTLQATSTNVVCFGDANGTANTVVAGGTPPLQYIWNTGSTNTNINNLSPGNYSVTVTDANGCAVSASVTITEPTLLQVSTTSTNVNCFGAANGTGVSSVSGGTAPYLYHWSNNASTPNINNLAPGTYGLTVTDQHGCTATSAVTITQPTVLTATTAQTNVLCNGDPTGGASVSASGGTGLYTYSWSNGATTNVITGVLAGTYSVTVTDANGCTVVRTVTVTEPTPLVVSATATDVICYGAGDGTATAIVSGGTTLYQYAWSNNTGFQSAYSLVAGNYTVTVTDAHGCTGSASVTVNEPPQIVATITGDSSICDYDSVRLFGTAIGGIPAYSYTWVSIPNGAFDTTQNLVCIGRETRTYLFTVTDQNGCIGQTTREVVSNVVPTVAFFPSRDEACDSATILFTNETLPLGCTYNWTFGDAGTSNDFSPEHFYGTGLFGVGLTATTPEGCTASIYRQDLILILPTPVASFESDPNLTTIDYQLLSQATFAFNNTSPWYATSVNWSFGNGDSAFVGQVTYTYPDTGNYCVTLTAYNNFGCHDDTTQCVRIQQDPFLWIPTGFTPNGDGLNDQFLLGGIEIKSFQITIFDRWGKMLYFSDSINKSWDGNVANEGAPEGAYVYKVEAVNTLGMKFTRAGTVTLIR